MILRQLKNHRFIYDEEEKSLFIMDSTGSTVELDKVRMFSLFRFLIRVSQRMATPRRKKVIQDE